MRFVWGIPLHPFQSEIENGAINFGTRHLLEIVFLFLFERLQKGVKLVA